MTTPREKQNIGNAVDAAERLYQRTVTGATDRPTTVAQVVAMLNEFAREQAGRWRS